MHFLTFQVCSNLELDFCSKTLSLQTRVLLLMEFQSYWNVSSAYFVDLECCIVNEIKLWQTHSLQDSNRIFFVPVKLYTVSVMRVTFVRQTTPLKVNRKTFETAHTWSRQFYTIIQSDLSIRINDQMHVFYWGPMNDR